MKKTVSVFALSLLLLILIAEGVSRISWGMPPCELDPPGFKFAHVDIHHRFFKKVCKENKDIYVPQRLKSNAKEFAAVKDPDTLRIFILGGSVVRGRNNQKNFSLFEHTLKDLIPDKDFEIINCGMDGYDSFRVYLVAKEILSYKPDLIIVLSGNNEFYEQVRINLGAYYINKALRKLWVYRKLQNYFLQWLDEHDLIYERGIEKKFADYKRNIQGIVKIAKARSVPIILCTLPVNFRDCPPGGRSPLGKQFLLAKFLLENGNYSEAIGLFEEFLQDNPNNSFGYHFLGRAFDKTEDYRKAKENYLTALDLSSDIWDSANFRSNKIIRRVSVEEGAGLADLAKAFMDIASYGLLGREQFVDNCHWWGEYYSLVARVIIKEMTQDNKIYSQIFKSDRYKLGPPSYNFLSLEERGKYKDDVRWASAVAIWKVIESGGVTIAADCRLKDELSERAICYFETLYSMNPDELWNLQFSEEKIKRILLKNPWVNEFISNSTIFKRRWPLIMYHVGETYRRLKLYKEALAYFNNAIALDKDSYLPYLGQSLTYHALGEKRKTQDSMRKAEEFSESIEIKHYKDILGL